MLALLLLGVLFAFFLQEKIYQKYWDWKLEVRTSFVETHVYEGDTSYLREEISNDKKLPLPALEVRLAVSRSLEFAREADVNTNVTDQSYKRDIFSFLFHQKVIHTLPFICKRRGFYEISAVEAVGYDLFFSSRFYREIAQQTQLYVYPAQADARRIRLVCQAVSGMALSRNRLYPDPFEFCGIREYRMDPMRSVNWKASAKSGVLMVNQFDSTTSVCVTLILDVEDSRILRYESLTEEGIRIASSLSARMIKENMELRLVSNAVYESHEDGAAREETLSWHAKPGAGRIQELNRRLACIDTNQCAEEMNILLQKEMLKKQAGQIYVLISKNQDILSENMLRALASGNEILWIIPTMPGMELRHINIPGVRTMRWEVGVQ